MSFTLDKFIALRPYLYHLTSRENLASILTRKRLYPAIQFMRQADRLEHSSSLRRAHLPIECKGRKILIRDQKPLHNGNIEWEPGWNMERFAQHLNDRVFFWPGDDTNPISAGLNHLERYKSENPILIKVKTEFLFGENAEVHPEFCRFNSGAPRTVNGRKSPRGSRTFLSAEAADFPAGKVCEVTFKGEVRLPYELNCFDTSGGLWRVEYPSDVLDSDIPK